MKTDAIFYVFMLSLSFVASVKVFNVDIMTPNNKIDTQLTQIKLQLLTSSNHLSLKEFVKRIEDMFKNIEEDQAKHESINKKMNLQCSEEEKFRKIEIANAEAAFKASFDAESKCSQSLAAAKSFLPELESTVKDYKNQIKVKTQEREIQHKRYLQMKEEWENAITFLGSFVIKIDEAIKDGKKASLIQLNENLIKKVTKLKRTNHLVPIFLALEEATKSHEKNNSIGNKTVDDDDDDEDEVVGKKVASKKNTTRVINVSHANITIHNHTQSNHTHNVSSNHTIHNHNHSNHTHNVSSHNTTHHITHSNHTNHKFNFLKNITHKNHTTNSTSSTVNQTYRGAAASISANTLTNLTIVTNTTTQNFTNITLNTTVKEEPLTDDKLIKLREVVQKLIFQLKKDSYEADIEEESLIKDFERLIKEFNIIIQELNKNIVRINNQIAEMDECVKKERSIMESASAKKIRNSKLLSLADKTCLDFVRSFVEATKNRYRQIQVIKDILVIVKRRFGELPSSLVKEIDEMNGEFKHYVNTTEFQKYVEITKVHIEDNLHGRKLSDN